MKQSMINLQPDMHFSYSQFFVYDKSVVTPGCEWTKAHSDQGFARRDSSVAVGTLLEYGTAKVVVVMCPYKPQEEYERVIAVPFLVCSGKVVVDGPEEADIGRTFALPSGNYRLVAAQQKLGDKEEVIHLFCESVMKPLEQSEVILADEALSPPTPLIETARVAE
jgi:hypothetical protein